MKHGVRQLPQRDEVKVYFEGGMIVIEQQSNDPTLEDRRDIVSLPPQDVPTIIEWLHELHKEWEEVRAQNEES